MTMTDAELAEIRAPMTREDVQYIHNSKAMHYSNMPVEIRQLCADYIALLDELAAARETIRAIAELDGVSAFFRDEYVALLAQDRARTYLHSATEDADDRTT